jgi:2-oxoglutarate ferredoxin oxidoreductase subunit beta
MAAMKDLLTRENPTWCPGCGDFGILMSVRQAIEKLGWKQEDTVIVSGIGCGSKLPRFVKVYGFEGLHGRALPAATAIKIANNALNVVVVTGDGDGLGIGGNHFIQTMRRNLNITHIIEDNEVYGLTKGQYSPTSPEGFKSPTSLSGALETPLNPVLTAVSNGATFVARTDMLNPAKLTDIFVKAFSHKGYSVVDVLQLCPTYNKKHDIKWYKERLVDLPEDYDPTDKVNAFKKALEVTEQISTGIFYTEERPTYEEQIEQIKKEPLAKQDIENVDISKLYDKFR